MKLSPVGSIKPFWLPPTTQSIFHSSMRKSSEPSDEMVSTRNSAGCFASSIAARISASGSIMPVAVSLCTTHTALIACAVSAASADFTWAGSTPRRQSQATRRTSSPCARAMLAHSSEKYPDSSTRIASPGDSRLVSEASHAPWPDALYMNRWCCVFSTRFTPANAAS